MFGTPPETIVLVPQRLHLLRIRRLAMARESDNDRHCHGTLCGSYCQCEEEEYLSVDRGGFMSKRQERDTRRSHHHFYTHENDENVAPGQHAHHSDDEQCCTHKQKVIRCQFHSNVPNPQRTTSMYRPDSCTRLRLVS